MDIKEVPQDTPVVLLNKETGHKLEGKFIKYLPECVRYEFQIYIGGAPHGTRVLLHKDTFTRYDVVPL